MNYKKSYYLLSICLWSGAGISFIGIQIGSRTDAAKFGSFLAFIGLIIMFAGIVQALIFYKCPNCGKRLDIRGRKAKFCPECGCKLD